jgi:hypothetical protein
MHPGGRPGFVGGERRDWLLHVVLGRWLVVLLEHRRLLVVLLLLRQLHGVRRRLVLGQLLLVVEGWLLLLGWFGV